MTKLLKTGMTALLMCGFAGMAAAEGVYVVDANNTRKCIWNEEGVEDTYKVPLLEGMYLYVNWGDIFKLHDDPTITYASGSYEVMALDDKGEPDAGRKVPYEAYNPNGDDWTYFKIPATGRYGIVQDKDREPTYSNVIICRLTEYVDPKYLP